MGKLHLSLFLLALPLGAWAQSATALIKEGERLYEEGEYRKAAEVLTRAHQLMPNAKLVFNIARSYDQAGDLNEALSYYQQYVNSPDGTDPLALKRAGLAIDRLRRQLGKEEAERAASEAERKLLEQEAATAKAHAASEAEASRRAQEAHQLQMKAEHEEALASWQLRRSLAFALGGAAVTATGVGTLVGLRARDARQSFDAAMTVEDKRSAADATRTQALLADVGFGVGLAAAVTAVLLYPKDAAPAAVLAPAPSGLGAGLEVRF